MFLLFSECNGEEVVLSSDAACSVICFHRIDGLLHDNIDDCGAMNEAHESNCVANSRRDSDEQFIVLLPGPVEYVVASLLGEIKKTSDFNKKSG